MLPGSLMIQKNGYLNDYSQNMFAKLGLYKESVAQLQAGFMYCYCFEVVVETVLQPWRQINSSSLALASLKPLALSSTASSNSLTNAYK